MNWKNTPKGVKAKVEKADKKAKSGGDPHGRTTKEKVVDFAKGVGLTSGQKKARDFAIGGAALATGALGNLASRAANIVKKAQAHKKE
jgi:hypothetical protein